MANEMGITPLHDACSKGHTAVVRALLSAPGIDVNAMNKNGSTPLHSACQFGHTAEVQALLDAPEVDLNVAKREGRTALQVAQTWDIGAMSVLWPQGRPRGGPGAAHAARKVFPGK